MTKEILDQARGDLRKVEEDFKKQISKFRTGRASVSILDGIHVDYYGVSTPINQLATLGVPEANLIIIQPWDSKIINDVDKAVRAANLNLNPVSDGKVIKLPIPPPGPAAPPGDHQDPAQVHRGAPRPAAQRPPRLPRHDQVHEGRPRHQRGRREARL